MAGPASEQGLRFRPRMADLYAFFAYVGGYAFRLAMSFVIFGHFHQCKYAVRSTTSRAKTFQCALHFLVHCKGVVHPGGRADSGKEPSRLHCARTVIRDGADALSTAIAAGDGGSASGILRCDPMRAPPRSALLPAASLLPRCPRNVRMCGPRFVFLSDVQSEAHSPTDGRKLRRRQGCDQRSDLHFGDSLQVVAVDGAIAALAIIPR